MWAAGTSASSPHWKNGGGRAGEAGLGGVTLSDNERWSRGKEWREAAGTFCIQPLIRKIRSVKGSK